MYYFDSTSEPDNENDIYPLCQENNNRISIILDNNTHKFKYEILPDRFLMTEAIWDCNKGKDDWRIGWNGAPATFLLYFPLSSLDYNLWSNVDLTADGEDAENLNGWWEPTMIIIDPEGYRDWVNRSNSERNRKMRERTLDKAGKFRVIESFEDKELQLEFFNEWIQ